MGENGNRNYFQMIARNNRSGKHTRVRITRREIEKAREQLLQEESSKAKSISRERKYAKDAWRDGIYFDSYGWAWGLNENLRTICLGRTKDVLKRRSSFASENESYSCHSKLKTDAAGISSGGAKFVVATFKKDPRFLRLLEHLISKGYGIRAIRSELKAKGCEIPLRTLGRWIKQQREIEDASS